MEPIKSNHLLNQYPPLDLTEIKSQPLKLTKITTLMAVQGSFSAGDFDPHYSAHDFQNLLQTWVVLSPKRCHSPPTFSSVW
ncbi:hypothetical protein HanXRQr2_Chr16g0754851 [Helianthus annuus]|uniref:Uncharacterized protein n=1 Tax=Helianthus annuus TaxID=4232 RepID=A0A251S0F2_HELAN|nr:hypothetical protein HanXRQr2_Chr16g0754851 [Helianthus annuus]KAJ0821718.1 hypothetical protein HanPSC8_Chr16g0723521 [Helianthus annuus]